MTSLIVDILPTTPMQEGMLLLERSSAKKSLYKEQYVARLTGNLDIRLFLSAWQKTVDTHTILRTIFDWDGQNDPVQIVLRQHKADVKVVDSLQGSQTKDDVIAAEAIKEFKIDVTPPHQLLLVRMSPNDYIMVFTYHHLLLDGSSVASIFNYFAEQYNSPDTLRPELNNYGEYTRWVLAVPKQDAISAWRTYADLSQLDPEKGAVEDTNDITQEYSRVLTGDTVGMLSSLVRKYHVTMSSVLQIMWAQTVAQMNSRQLVSVGSPVTVRPLDGSLDSIVGLCINTLPYVVMFDGKSGFINLVKQHQQSWGGLIGFGGLSLSDIKKALKYRHFGDTFGTLFTYTDERDRAMPNLVDVEWQLVSHDEITQYPLSVDCVLRDEALEIKVTYRSGTYDESLVAKVVSNFIGIIKSVVVDPNLIPQVSEEYESVTQPPDVSYGPTELAGEIADVWSIVFSAPVSINSNFFDLGGDSISSLRIVSKLSERGIVVSMRDIFDAPSPLLLASRANRHTEPPGKVHRTIVRSEVHDEALHRFGDNLDTIVKASSVQSGILNRSASRAQLYHDQSTFTYEGVLKVELFERAWNEVVRNNDSLLMRYFQHEGIWYCTKLKSDSLVVRFRDIAEEPNHNDLIRRDIDADLQTPFSVEDKPLIRLTVYRQARDIHTLFLSFNILVTDGWGFAFLLDDVFTAYEQLVKGEEVRLVERLPSYTDYLGAITPRDILVGRQYWQEKLRKCVSPGVVIDNFSNLSSMREVLDDMQTARLQQLANAQKLTVNSLVQAAWARVLNGQSGGQPVLFGSTISARLLHGVHYDNTVGMFFNDIPVVVRCEESDEIASLARNIQRDFQESVRYGYVSSYEMSKMLGRSSEQAPYDSIVVFENYPKVEEESLRNNSRGGLVNSAFWRRDMADIPKTLYVEVIGNETAIRLSYNQDLVSRQEAEAMLGKFYRELLSCIS